MAGEGLPDPRGTTASTLAADPAQPGVFYAVNNHGAFRSADAGRRWQRLELPWPERWRGERVKGVGVG